MKSTGENRYALHPGYQMMESVLTNLKNKTGRSMKEWERLLKSKGPKDKAAWAEWLKAKHKIGTNTARFVAETARGVDHSYDPDAYIEAMFAPPRENLREVYEKIRAFAFKLGRDVTATPCKTIVPFRRKFVFAQVKPVSKSRIELGFALGSTKASGRLLSTGGLAKGDRITHKISISHIEEFDDEARRWLRAAFEKCPAAD